MRSYVWASLWRSQMEGVMQSCGKDIVEIAHQLAIMVIGQIFWQKYGCFDDRHDLKTTENSGHGQVPTYVASWLTVS